MGIPLPITTSFWSKWSPDGSCINVIPKSGLRWPSPMPLDLGQHQLRSTSRHLFLSLDFAVFGGLGCWLTWREPGCDSFATALSGSRQNCSIKVTTRALANGVSVDPAKKRTLQPASVQTQRPTPCQSADGFRFCWARGKAKRCLLVKGVLCQTSVDECRFAVLAPTRCLFAPKRELSSDRRMPI